MSYQEHYEWAKTELAKIEVNRQKVIQDLAARLEAAGLPLDMIASEIATHLEGYISAQYIRRVLDKKYKQDSKNRTIEGKTEKPETQIAITNDGTNVTQPPPEPERKQPTTPTIKNPPPEDPKDNVLQLENEFLKEQISELRDALKKMEQFKIASQLQEQPTAAKDPNPTPELQLTDDLVFQYLRDRAKETGNILIIDRVGAGALVQALSQYKNSFGVAELFLRIIK